MILLLYTLLSMLFKECSSLSTCERVQVTDMGIADGIYETFIDYRGRPDFFTDDGVFNLFGEDVTATTCYWRVDNTIERFPFYTSDDCSQHPVDITTQWFVNNENVLPIEIFPIIECIPGENNGNNKLLYILLSVFLFIILTVLLVLFHIRMRKKRIENWEKRCPLCTKKIVDASNFTKTISSNVDYCKQTNL